MSKNNKSGCSWLIYGCMIAFIIWSFTLGFTEGLICILMALFLIIFYDMLYGPPSFIKPFLGKRYNKDEKVDALLTLSGTIRNCSNSNIYGNAAFNATSYSTDSYFNGISRKFFDDITAADENLISMCEQLCRDERFTKEVAGNPHIDISLYGVKASTDEAIKILMQFDLTRCIVGLGNGINYNRPDSFGLFYFIARTKSLKPFEFHRLAFAIGEELRKSVTNHTLQMRHAIECNPSNEDEFVISAILEDIDINLKHRYLEMLCNFTSISAMSDGTMTDLEISWLDRISNLIKR